EVGYCVRLVCSCRIEVSQFLATGLFRLLFFELTARDTLSFWAGLNPNDMKWIRRGRAYLSWDGRQARPWQRRARHLRTGIGVDRSCKNWIIDTS
ncbi:hypothetical protein GW17_00056998, partial [Ensete ventricosum]